MKGKGDKKGATSKSSSSKSPAKGMSDSFKSKEFVSSDESSSAESKKEVGVAAGGRSWPPLPWGTSRWFPLERLGPLGTSCLWYLDSPEGLSPGPHRHPVPAVGAQEK